MPEEPPKPPNNSPTQLETSSDDKPSSISKILPFLKISKYVNDFLSSTRVKVKLKSIPRVRKKISPAETAKKTPNLSKKNFQFIKNTEKLPENQIISRLRAPSLGVASAVPSFGMILSSLEHSDSSETSPSTLSPPKSPKNYLKVPEIRQTYKNQHKKNISKDYPPKTQLQKPSHWPRKSLGHLLRALKHMKTRKISIEPPENSFLSTISPLNTYKSVTSSSSMSIYSFKSVRERQITPKTTESKPEPLKTPSKPSILDLIPNKTGIYPRKIDDKCLPCLEKSLNPKKNSLPNFLLSPDTSPSNSIIFDLKELITNSIKVREKGFNKNTEKLDLINENYSKPELIGLSSDFSTKPETREDKNSSGSFVSSQSLASERSKTISDHEDPADQGINEAMDTVESQLKFLAPCHAPLNLRRSLEPLRALQSKMAHSIQSRIASLEKTDAPSDEESDSNEDLSPTTTSISENPLNTTLKIHLNDSLTSNEIKNLINNTYNLNQGIITPENKSPRFFKNSLMNLSPTLGPLNTISSLKMSERLLETVRILSRAYVARLFSRKKLFNPNSQPVDIIKRLLMLLIDSQLYLQPLNPFHNPELSSCQVSPINSKQLRRVLPVKSYNLIAPLLGIPLWHPKRWSVVQDIRKDSASPKNRCLNTPSVQIYGSESSEASVGGGKKALNPYGMFIFKPKRKVITWRAVTQSDLEGYDPDGTLKKRAAKLTDKICTDFCEWLRGLGDYETTIDEAVLKEMFETDFTTDVRGVAKVPAGVLPTVPAVARGSRGGSDAGRRVVDVPTGFIDPWKLRPSRKDSRLRVGDELEAMEVVWKGIRHLDSVQRFFRWIQTHGKGF